MFPPLAFALVASKLNTSLLHVQVHKVMLQYPALTRLDMPSNLAKSHCAKVRRLLLLLLL